MRRSFPVGKLKEFSLSGFLGKVYIRHQPGLSEVKVLVTTPQSRAGACVPQLEKGLLSLSCEGGTRSIVVRVRTPMPLRLTCGERVGLVRCAAPLSRLIFRETEEGDIEVKSVEALRGKFAGTTKVSVGNLSGPGLLKVNSDAEISVKGTNAANLKASMNGSGKLLASGEFATVDVNATVFAQVAVNACAKEIRIVAVVGGPRITTLGNVAERLSARVAGMATIESKGSFGSVSVTARDSSKTNVSGDVQTDCALSGAGVSTVKCVGNFGGDLTLSARAFANVEARGAVHGQVHSESIGLATAQDLVVA